MKLLKTFSAAVLVASFTVTTAFAAVNISDSNQEYENNGVIASHFKDHEGKSFSKEHEEFEKDPIKFLEMKKEKIQTMLKEGKITKEKADKITAKIDSRIKSIKEFEKLTLPQKKEKLINDFKSKLDNRVKENKIDKSKADSMLKEFTEKVEKWDGKDGFKFLREQFRGFHKDHKDHGNDMKKN